MLYARPLTDCSDCDVHGLISEIDCKLAEMGKDLYNNISFSLNRKVPSEAILDLLNYKRILTYRLCNSCYADCFSNSQIASRVKLLKYK